MGVYYNSHRTSVYRTSLIIDIYGNVIAAKWSVNVTFVDKFWTSHKLRYSGLRCIVEHMCPYNTNCLEMAQFNFTQFKADEL